jgi:PAS domain S-box-containing protein
MALTLLTGLSLVSAAAAGLIVAPSLPAVWTLLGLVGVGAIGCALARAGTASAPAAPITSPTAIPASAPPSASRATSEPAGVPDTPPVVREYDSSELLTTLSRVQAQFISEPNSDVVFEGLLDDLLVLTDSRYGFIAEVVTPPSGPSFVEYRAIRHVSWATPSEESAAVATYSDLLPMVDAVRSSGRLVLLSGREQPRAPGLHGTFAGLPLATGVRLVGIIGLGDRQEGYEPRLLEFFQPAIASATTLLEAVKASGERRAAEERLRESETRYRDFLEHASDLVHSVRPDGSFAYVNRAWLQTLGYDEADVEHLTIWRVADAAVHEAYRALLTAPDEHVVTPLGEVVLWTRDGRRIECEGRETCRIVDGIVVATRGMFRDVSAQRRAAEALRVAKDHAEAAARAKSDFLANMSHEIRTPMNAVIGMTSLLLDTPLSSDQREFVEIIRNAGDGLLDIINDILDFSKIDSGKLELEQQPFAIRECVERAVDLLASSAAAKGIELLAYVDPRVPPLLVGDVTRVRQVLVNLLGNAIKFTDTGEVEVGVAASPIVEGRWRIHVSVRDTGTGIPPDRADRLFKAFSQVDTSTTRQHGGTGLGLAISRRLAELMGGTMWVDSEPGLGSTFQFTIVSAAADSGAAADAVPEIDAGRKAMVVQDNAASRRVVRLLLESWGFDVETASDATAAAAAIAARVPDVLLVDRRLRDADGIVLVQRLRASAATRHTPAVLLTALGHETTTTDGLGLVTCLAKPVKATALREAVLSALGRGHVAPSRPETRWTFDASMAERLPLRLLIAEDNIVNQKVAVKMLGRLGYRPDVVNNGLEAVEAVARQRYDVLLLDVQMPVMDGFEAARRITGAWSPGTRPRIVGMTALAMTGDRERCLEVGMDDYITKPVRPEELQRALERSAQAPPPVTRFAPPAVDAVDTSVIASLRELQDPDEPDFVTELIDLLFADMPGMLTALEQAAAEGNARGVNRIAHSMKSSCGNLGALPLSKVFFAIERQGAEGDLRAVRGLIAEATAEFGRVREALSAQRQGAPDGAAA